MTDAGDAFARDLAEVDVDVDLDTVAVLRRRWPYHDTDTRCRDAIDDLLAMPITRLPVGPANCSDAQHEPVGHAPLIAG